MRIYIPSRGRFKQSVILPGTLKYFNTELRQRTTVVVRVDEEQKYAWLRDEVGEVIAVSYETIDQKRLKIGQLAQSRGEEKFAMVDDDLTDFLVRRNEHEERQRMATSAEVQECFETVENVLDDYAQVSVSAREGNGLSGIVGGKLIMNENSRAMRAMSFRTEDFLSVEHCRVQCMEDHDVTLQLLKSGRKNAVLYWWSQGQKTYENAGGCSTWRTLSVHNAAATRLHELHPDVVRLRTTNKGGLGERLECTIQWKRAYKEKT
jgi:hypothetical protein